MLHWLLLLNKEFLISDFWFLHLSKLLWFAHTDWSAKRRSLRLLLLLRTLLPWRIFHTSADLLLFVPVSGYLPTPSPPHPSPNASLVYLCLCGISPFRLVLISPLFGVFLHVRNNWIFTFLTKFRSVPDVTQSESAMDWFVPCAVHYTRKMSLYHLFSNAFMRFVL